MTAWKAYARTVGEVLLFVTAQVVYRVLFPSVVGRASSTLARLQVQRPLLEQAFVLGVFAPLLEETLVRGLPILLARRILRKAPESAGTWIVGTFGVATSLVHALLHAPPSWMVGASHFVFGLVAWNAAWNRGLRHSILLHSVHNLVLLLVSTYFRSH